MKLRRHSQLFAALVTASCLGVTAGAATVVHTANHTFSINDIQGGFDGARVIEDPTIMCGAPIVGSPACEPDDTQPVTDSDGVTLYPIDSEFGFNVVDFLGAQEKAPNRDYAEGWAGDIFDGADQIGVKVSNAATAFYKVKPPLGTWCAGLGGTSVKCSTEHYTVLEHVLSCHETVPYFFANPLDATQAVQSFPDLSASFDCANAGLDDDLFIIENGEVTTNLLTSVIPGDQMDANDNTTVQDDIAVSRDYSVTLKDDGKPLYRWGGLIKRPNDVRLYARMELPAIWKTMPDVPFQVTSARLVVNHWITNNPNDQLRPEDMENEAATGRVPSYMVENGGTPDEIWLSTKSCFEGDGDYIDVEGTGDPTPIGTGTYLKNNIRSMDPAPPQSFSADLVKGLTNAWYTTIDRDPFEWSYRDLTTPANVFNYIGSPLPDDSLGELVSGPRWRLKANKYGQDIPGLEVIVDPPEGSELDCLPPPPSRDFIKYSVGDPTTTVINLLDFEGPSPLLTSHGWIDPAGNGVNILADPMVPGLSVNGLPLTDDFDLAVYIKGDRKPTALFDAELIIEFECPDGIDCGDADQDTVQDIVDNCTLVPNVDQRDTDEDGFGNACDPDLNNDGIVNAADVGELRSAFFNIGTDLDADFNGDNVVNVLDLAIMKQYFFLPPGPSGTAAALV